MIRFSIIAACVFLLSGPSSNGGLILNATGIAGTGSTTWTFGGNSTATGSGTFAFDSGGAPSSSQTWDNFSSDYTIVNNTWFTTTGAATLFVGAVSRNIDSIYIDEDAGGDDIAIGVDGATDLPFASGNLVQWAGSVIVDIDVNDLIAGSYSSTDLGGLELQLNVSAVPEPSGFLLAGMTLCYLIWVRRPRRLLKGS